MSESNSAVESSGGLLLGMEDFNRILDEQLPFAKDMGLAVDAFEHDHVRMRAVYSDRLLRPGGTIAGPVMMCLADTVGYAVVLSRIGLVELALTTQLSINFLRKPAPGDVLANASLLKLGKRLAVAEILLYNEEHGLNRPVAHATATYSIPPAQRREL